MFPGSIFDSRMLAQRLHMQRVIPPEELNPGFKARVKAKSLKKVLNALKPSIDDACIYSNGTSLIIRNLATDPESEYRTLILELVSSWFESFASSSSPLPFCISIHLLANIVGFVKDSDFCELCDGPSGFIISSDNTEGDKSFVHLLPRRSARHLWIMYKPQIPYIPYNNLSTIRMSSSEFFHGVQHLSSISDIIGVMIGPEGFSMTTQEVKECDRINYGHLVYYPYSTSTSLLGSSPAQDTSQSLPNGPRPPVIDATGAAKEEGRWDVPVEHLLAISRGQILSSQVHLSLSHHPETDPNNLCVKYKFGQSSLSYYLQARVHPNELDFGFAFRKFLSRLKGYLSVLPLKTIFVNVLFHAAINWKDTSRVIGVGLRLCTPLMDYAVRSTWLSGPTLRAAFTEALLTPSYHLSALICAAEDILPAL
ncbi:hypothetical protein BJ165DRAFT_1534507 [Panaeolus papilionaceus]|nr:hypothetical protein BJ165DRAFT_1534507 [Panaeolus papilionaceus]